MANAAIVDASPIILLARIGELDLLQLLAVEIQVPRAVVTEVFARGPADPAAAALEASPWIRRLSSLVVPADLVARDLGQGESEVIAHARLVPGALAVIDDQEARRAAEALGIPCLGTLGVVARARLAGRISSAAGVFLRLRDAGMWVRPALLEETLRRLGE